MKTLLKHLRDYKLQSILGPLFKLLEAAFELFIPLVVANIIDRGISQKDSGYIIKMCLLMVSLGIIGLIFSVTAQYFSARAAVGSMTKLRSAIFDKIQGFDYKTLDKIGVSTLITRITGDVNQVQTGINLTLRLLLRSPLVVIGAAVMAFTIDKKSSLIFVVTIAALSVVVFGIMLISIPLYKRVQTRVDGMVRATRENLGGVRVLRAFNKEESEISQFDSKNDLLSSAQKFVGSISALMNPVTYIIINAGIVWLIYAGALKVDAGILTTGQVVALYNYMTQILVELIKLASLIITITKSVASAHRIDAVMNIAPENEEGDTADINSENILEFKNVSLCYEGAGDSTLEDISFGVKRGETVGIIGGTGSGKTSLVNLIPAFYGASAGEITLFGKDISTLSKRFIRENVAITPQKATLFSGTIRENLLWGAGDADDDALMRAVSLAQAIDVVDAKGGLDAKIEQGGKNLSGGQRARLTIARALVKNAPILILDDSASALDFATDAALRQAIATLDNTVFIVSQRASSVMQADKIILLDDGKISAMGKHAELMESSEIYREIYYTQFEKENGDEN